MIFSLSDAENEIVLPRLSDIDIICFFRVQNAVKADQILWWKTLSASLRGKQSVLLLESELSAWPAFDQSQRWQTGDNWCWLTPRSLSVISKAYQANPMEYPDFKTLLTNHKSK